ncbi:hypothetical protein [Xylanimonas sp. McL0601]|uniref:hypothetical protein n=1 Tax=Xylanimonas sp. McL0601 TaxID=3414739 RepID=UPI003CF4B815
MAEELGSQIGAPCAADLGRHGATERVRRGDIDPARKRRRMFAVSSGVPLRLKYTWCLGGKGPVFLSRSVERRR